MNETKYIVPSATLSESPEKFELKFVVPGIGKGDADLHIEGKTLTLKTHAKHEAPEGFKVAAEEFDRLAPSMAAARPAGPPPIMASFTCFICPSPPWCCR